MSIYTSMIENFLRDEYITGEHNIKEEHREIERRSIKSLLDDEFGDHINNILV